MKATNVVFRARLVWLASALSVLAGCATTTRVATDEFDSTPALGSAEDSDLRAPQVLRQVEPQYPIDMRRAGIGGFVYVNCLVDENGHVARATARSNTNSELTAAALRAVKGWSFSPGTQNGVAVPMRVSVPIVFELAER